MDLTTVKEEILFMLVRRVFYHMIYIFENSFKFRIKRKQLNTTTKDRKKKEIVHLCNLVKNILLRLYDVSVLSTWSDYTSSDSL